MIQLTAVPRRGAVTVAWHARYSRRGVTAQSANYGALGLNGGGLRNNRRVKSAHSACLHLDPRPPLQAFDDAGEVRLRPDSDLNLLFASSRSRCTALATHIGTPSACASCGVGNEQLVRYLRHGALILCSDPLYEPFLRSLFQEPPIGYAKMELRQQRSGIRRDQRQSKPHHRLAVVDRHRQPFEPGQRQRQRRNLSTILPTLRASSWMFHHAAAIAQSTRTTITPIPCQVAGAATTATRS